MRNVPCLLVFIYCLAGIGACEARSQSVRQVEMILFEPLAQLREPHVQPREQGADGTPVRQPESLYDAPIMDSAIPATFPAVPDWMRAGTRSVWAMAHADICTAPIYHPAGFIRGETERRRAAYYALMSEIACENGLPTGLFDALILAESRYRPDALSRRLAFGLTQLMHETARELGVDRYSVEGNLRGGARYLRQMLDRFGDYHLAIAAYNAGPGRIRNGQMPPIKETRIYVHEVLSTWQRLGAYPLSSGSANLIAQAVPMRRVTVQRFARAAADLPGS